MLCRTANLWMPLVQGYRLNDFFDRTGGNHRTGLLNHEVMQAFHIAGDVRRVLYLRHALSLGVRGFLPAGLAFQ